LEKKKEAMEMSMLKWTKNPLKRGYMLSEFFFFLTKEDAKTIFLSEGGAQWLEWLQDRRAHRSMAIKTLLL
jgi:hypothetical protein